MVRVLVNFAHTFGNGGGFDSGLNFTLSMGCGSWQKNSISENLSYRHFLNITHLVTRDPGGQAERGGAVRPALDALRQSGRRPMNFEEHVGQGAGAGARRASPVPRPSLRERRRRPPKPSPRSGRAWSRPRCRRASAARPAAIRPADSAEEAGRRRRGDPRHVDRRPRGRDACSWRSARAIAREFYAAVLPRRDRRSARSSCSPPKAAWTSRRSRPSGPDALRRLHRRHRSPASTGRDAAAMLARPRPRRRRRGWSPRSWSDSTAPTVERDAELLEINPLALLDDGRARRARLQVHARRCRRLPPARPRRRGGAKEPLTDLERRGAEHGLKFIQLDGDVGVLANGAGLTMTTMDVITHLGGRPANFLEIGGEAYTKSEIALDLVLSNPGREEPRREFLRRLRPHRRDGRRRRQGLGDAEAERAGVLLHPRHRRGRGRAPWCASASASNPTTSWRTPSRAAVEAAADDRAAGIIVCSSRASPASRAPSGPRR